MPAPQEILKLVSRFREQYDTYRSPKYNETRTRKEFIDPFFESLGWDMANVRGYADAYAEVIHEDSIKMGSSTKAPDYSFRIGGARKFFLEAKAPSVNLKEDVSPAFQVRRYGWSAKLALSVLTDFHEFAVYDCRIRPEKNDKASTARTLYLNYEEYESRWDEIASIFSRDAILKGSFDKYAESNKKKRGTAEVDAAFLQDIEEWRSDLARNLALRNPELSQRELNTAVQKTIDRMVFLRICEDRGIELYGRLQSLLNGPKVYARLCELFRDADTKYNSGLFHFHTEKERHEPPDEWTLKLEIDDAILKTILRKLYYPESPYEFSVLGADILGQVYEQFLGKVIRLTKGHRAVVEDKPEVKKAGGVYYTPTYIVDYIVENTVGKLVEGKQPHEVAGRTEKFNPSKNLRPLSVLDPACGSGSFLIGAYQYLLDWYRDRYVDDGPQQHKQRLYQTRSDEWRLTTDERKRILLDHIYGVDIDPQAVEVTKLSLLLKVLEGETKETLQRQLFAKQRALPDLAGNIKCGNSLIGPDFYTGRQMDMFDEDERLRINVFDWQTEFAAIMKAGGFDAVIGNPPYIRIQTMKEWAPDEVEHYKKRYQAASKGNYDIYVVFVERGLAILNDSGRFGFILPHKFFNAQYGMPLRELIAKGHHISEIVHFGHQQVFHGATTYTCLLFLSQSRSKDWRFLKVNDLQEWRTSATASEAMMTASQVDAQEWNFIAGGIGRVIEQMDRLPDKLGHIARLFVGLQTDADDVYIVEQLKTDGARVLCASKSTGEQHWFEDDHLKPFLKGSLNIRRYQLTDVNKRLIFPYETRTGKSVLIDSAHYHDAFPLTWQYLEMNRARLTKRNKGRMGSEWYGYVYKKNHTRFGVSKLLVPSIAAGSCFAPDLEGRYFFVGSGGGGGGGYAIAINEDVEISPLFLLGLLNSRAISSYLLTTSTPFRGGYIALNRQYIEKLPIRIVDRNESVHNGVVTLVEQMLRLHKQSASVKTAHERTAVQRQIVATDREIDALVYELYGLSDEEIRLVEEATAR